jgi:hypothetical protein
MPTRPLVQSLVLAVVAVVLAAAPVDAGRKWCQKDPGFLVAGTYVSVDIAVYDDLTHHVTGPISVTLSVPPGTNATVAFLDDGFNGLGEAVSILTDDHLQTTGRGIQIRVVVVVPAAIGMPSIGTVYPGTGKPVTVNGQTNNTIPINATVKPST